MALKIYLAGGWFSKKQENVLTKIEKVLFSQSNLEVFSPRKETKIKTGSDINSKAIRQEIFNLNLKHIEESDVVIASTEGKDMGTIWECGYAFALKKPIFYVYLTDNPNGFNLMLSESSTGVIMTEYKLTQLSKILNTWGSFGYKGKIE
jgi:nucleoside 2-deoxyribosyltransferase